MIAALVCVRYLYKKRQDYHVHGRSSDADTIQLYHKQPPDFISTQPTEDVFASTDVDNESLPKYTPSDPLPDYVFDDMANAAENIVQ